jgi:acyl dehydratase
MEVVGIGFYFEDLRVGRQYRTIGRTVTETDVLSYVNCLGLVEVLFTNQEFREHGSDIKGRIAPGMLAHGVIEGLLIQATMQNTALALMNMEITMKAPVFVGDTIHGEVEILEARVSKSRPGRGLVRSRVNIVKQDGTVAITYTPLRMVKCREAK